MYRPRMHRLVWVPLLLCAACGTNEDDRPLELEYLTQAIFVPSCGVTQCHSSFVQARELVLDTPEGVRRGLVDRGLILFDSPQYDPDDPTNAALIIWITEIDPFGLGVGRMPFDQPMPNRDVLLLKEWIEAEAPGAQCNPELNSGMACNNKEVVQCNADWTFGTRVQLCPGDCIQGQCR
jgi:hypothetical protein